MTYPESQSYGVPERTDVPQLVGQATTLRSRPTQCSVSCPCLRARPRKRRVCFCRGAASRAWATRVIRLPLSVPCWSGLILALRRDARDRVREKAASCATRCAAHTDPSWIHPSSIVPRRSCGSVPGREASRGKRFQAGWCGRYAAVGGYSGARADRSFRVGRRPRGRGA